MKKVLLPLLLSSCVMSCSNNVVLQKNEQPKINNIIMVIADGMGPAYTSAYRYYADDINTPEIEKTVFDKHLVALSTTYPDPVSGYVTDSAAAATALATGFKTYNDAISVDVNKQPLETVLERAKSIGMKTGVVVTSQINHATPASYLAHNEHRRNYNEIADSYIDDGIKADVYLGGGWKYFLREDRNLVTEFESKGFHYIDNYSDLTSVPKNTPLLGLFGDKGLPAAMDDENPFRLSMLTQAAIQQLENPQGYFMLVEASQVDWAGHGRDIASAMHEMADLAKTMEFLAQYVKENPDTLVILTADHSTGGLSIGRKTGKTDPSIKSNYLWKPGIIKKMTRTPGAFAKIFSKKDLSIAQMHDLLNFSLTKDEYNQILLAKHNALATLAEFKANKAKQKNSHKKSYPPNVAKMISATLKKIIDVKTNTGWGSISRSGTHTGIDVPVIVIGNGKTLFTGSIDNTDIAKGIFTLLESK